MAEVLAFSRKEDDTGVDLETITGDYTVNVFFPGNTPEYTIAVSTKVDSINDTIKSKTHQLAVWHALAQIDNMRKTAFAGAEGVAGFFGDETQVEIQVGIVPPKVH
jgi:hypothetical protein